jgi:hypothetical protein
MNHMLPTHSLSETDHTSLQPTYGMDPNGVVTTGGPPPQAPAKGNRKRQRASDAAANAGVSVVGAPGGPEDVPMAAGGGRRLRRLHEACARCRMKKIKASPVGRTREAGCFFFCPGCSPIVGCIF